MAARARDILRRIGYAEDPADTARGFSNDTDVLNWINAQGPGYVNSPRLASGRPSPAVFWYRDSPATLVPGLNPGGGSIGPGDPPMAVSRMRLVQLDARGQLLELTVVPDAVARHSAASRCSRRYEGQ